MPATTIATRVSSTVAEVQLDIRFSPFDETTEPFLELVQSATRSLFFVIYGFTLSALVDDIIAKHQAGLTVGGILDHTQAEGTAEKVQLQRLLAAGVPFLIGVSPDASNIIHSKFVVADERDVETGSWNFSASAARQSNNMLLIKGHPDVAAIYLRHYDRLRAVILHLQSRLQLAGEAADPLALPDDASIDTAVQPDAPQVVAAAKVAKTSRPGTPRAAKKVPVAA